MSETASTVNDAEIAKFTAMAEEWWNPKGKFKPLHKFNPVRLTYIRDHLVRHFGRDAQSIRPFEGLKILDVGCGGGLLCEPLATCKVPSRRNRSSRLALFRSCEEVGVIRCWRDRSSIWQLRSSRWSTMNLRACHQDAGLQIQRW